ncbi:MAG TPA: TonB-dependent receptor, partial [Thermoanaerobaculia bacterium]
LAAAILAAAPLFAEIPFAALTGRVTSNDAPAAGVVVTATCDALPQPRTTTTLADGTYWLPALPPGPCSVTFSREGLQTLTRPAYLVAGDLARSDASIQPSEEGESVTSTATARSLFERPFAVWSMDAATIAQLPMTRSGAGPLSLAPRTSSSRSLFADGMRIADVRDFAVLDALEQVAVPLDDAPVALVGRSGGPFSASLRATLTHRHDSDVEVEATAGGSIGEHLFLFGAAEGGDDHSLYAKAAANLGAQHAFFAAVLDDEAALDWTYAATDRLTATASVSDSDASARGYALVGRHQLALGGGDEGVFVSDRWALAPRWIVEAGVRHDHGDTSARAGAVFDLFGDGRKRLAANVTGDEYQLWYGQQLEANGYARVGVIRDEGTDVVVDAAFRFLVLTFGGNVSLLDRRDDVANVWVLFDAPLLERDLGIALVGRYTGDHTALDAAVNFSMPVGRITPFVKLEVLNAFSDRTWQIGLGARM